MTVSEGFAPKKSLSFTYMRLFAPSENAELSSIYVKVKPLSIPNVSLANLTRNDHQENVAIRYFDR